MRTTRSFVSALAVISVGALFIAAQPAKAENVFRWYFNQTGSNTVVVTGTGSFDLDALGDPTNASAEEVDSSEFIPEAFTSGTISGTRKEWVSGTSQVLSGSSFFFSGGISPSGFTDGDWVEMYAPGDVNGSSLALNANYVSGAPISNTTTLVGFSLTDFGFSEDGTLASPFLEGTWTLQNPDTGDPAGTISIYSINSVPEPSQMMLLAGAGLTVGAWRMRKLRRKSVASTATAC